MTTPQPVTLNHTFTTGHQLTIRMEDGLVAGRFIWSPGKPPPHVFQPEYQEFIRSVMPGVANHFGKNIIWFLPGEIMEPAEFVLFEPSEPSTLVFKNDTSTDSHQCLQPR